MTKRYHVPPISAAGAVARSNVGEDNWQKKGSCYAVAQTLERWIDGKKSAAGAVAQSHVGEKN